MRILIACEYSAIVRDAFRARGHDAWSCDLEPTEGNSRWHIQGDVLGILNGGWDMMIAHPECRYLCNSGIKHLYKGGKKINGPCPERWNNFAKAGVFFLELWEADIPIKVLENSEMHTYAVQVLGMEDRGALHQIIQPWMFGTKETKATHIWRTENLSELTETDNVYDEMMKLPKKERSKCHYFSPGKDRGKLRAKFDPGIAKAMAEQWG